MDSCPYCKKFEKYLLPQIREECKDYKIKTINREESPKLIQKYNIKSYPSLVRTENWKLFKGERTLNNIKRFLYSD